MFSIGQVVYSKSGRDKGGAFVVVGIEKDFIYIADGRTRPLSKPKKKNIKHIQRVNDIDFDIKRKIENKEYILDSDLRSSLKKYKSQ